MAAPQKDGKVWRHRVMVKGRRVSGTFSTKAAALAWEAEQRVQLVEGQHGATGKTVRDALERYEIEVSRKKRGHLNEAKRLAWFRESSIASIKMSEIKAGDIAAWRDGRLKSVKGSTVNRDLNILSHVFTIARREWGWITTSPTNVTVVSGLTFGHDLSLEHSVNALENLVTNARQPILDETASEC